MQACSRAGRGGHVTDLKHLDGLAHRVAARLERLESLARKLVQQLVARALLGSQLHRHDLHECGRQLEQRISASEYE